MKAKPKHFIPRPEGAVRKFTSSKKLFAHNSKREMWGSIRLLSSPLPIQMATSWLPQCHTTTQMGRRRAELRDTVSQSIQSKERVRLMLDTPR